MLYGDPALRRRWGMTFLVCCWTMVSWSQEDPVHWPTVWMLQPTKRRGKRRTERSCSCAIRILIALSPVLQKRFEPTRRRGRGIIAGLAYLDLSDARHAYGTANGRQQST